MWAGRLAVGIVVVGTVAVVVMAASTFLEAVK
jgi:hypothetical protein